MIDELRGKIYQILNPILKSFYLFAPTGEKLPYCVFSFISIPNIKDSSNIIERVQLQVSIFDLSASSLFEYESQIKTALDNAKNDLIGTGYTMVGVERLFIRYDLIDEIFASYLNYEIIIN